MKPQLAQIFNEDAQSYAMFRPGYPVEAFQAIFDYSGVNLASHILEVGAGTGQATLPFLERGLCVDAIEPGEHLADELDRKFSAFTRLSVKKCLLEDLRAPSQTYDLIFSASAFHWVPKTNSYRDCFRMLKPMGTLALFWNSFSVNRPNDSTHEVLQSIFQCFGFGMTESSYQAQRYERKQNSLRKRGFVDVDLRLFQTAQHYPLNQFLGLLSTTSRYRSLSPDVQEELFRTIKLSLSSQENLWVDQTCDLYLARRP